MAAITVCSDFGAPKNKVWHCFRCLPIYFPWGDGTGCHDLSTRPNCSRGLLDGRGFCLSGECCEWVSVTPRAAFMQARTPPLPATAGLLLGLLHSSACRLGATAAHCWTRIIVWDQAAIVLFLVMSWRAKGKYFASESTSREIPLLREIPGLGFSVSRGRNVSFWGKQNYWRDTVLSLVFLCRNGIIPVICIKFMIISFQYDSRPFVYKALYCFFRQDIILELWR